MAALLASGFVLGAVISIPLGALGALMIDRAIRDGLWAGFSLGLMSAVMDAFCCGLSLGGMSLMLKVPILRVLAQGVGLLVLVFLGIRSLFSRQREADLADARDSRARTLLNNQRTRQLENIIVVLMYQLFNPTSIAFWANMAGTIHSTILRSGAINEYVLFSAGVGFGSASTQLISLILVRKADEKSTATRGIVRRFSLIAFVSTIAYFSYSLAREVVNLI